MIEKLSGKSIKWIGFIVLISTVQLAAETAEPSAVDKELTLRSIDSYLQRLDALEEQYGAYEPELGQELSGLGTLYQANGQHKEALAAFKRQYQIARTNDGLYSLSQVETLQKMIVSLIALREWDEVSDRHFFLQQLVSRNYARDDLRKVKALTDMADWHLYAYEAKLDQNRMMHLLTARNALSETGAILGANSSRDNEQLEKVYNQLLFTDYQIAVTEQQSAAEAQARAAFEQRVNRDLYNNTRNDELARRQRTSANSFVAGVRHLEDLRNIYANDPSAPTGATAKVDAQIGDWYSLWQKHNTARSYYSKAWNELATNPAAATALQETFGEPVRLLSFVDKYEASLMGSPGTKQGYVVFDLSVSSAGRVKVNTILENEPADRTREISRATQTVARARYRPRYENGIPVATDNLQLRYVFEYVPD